MTRPQLSAAVIEPNSPGADTSARVIPDKAKRVRLGTADAGYWHDPNKRESNWSLPAQRVPEVERLIEARHGGTCDTDDGASYAVVALHCLVRRALTVFAGRVDPLAAAREHLREWCSQWTPLLPADEVDLIIDVAMASQRNLTADRAAEVLKLRMAERMALKITTIGAIDCNKEQRVSARKARNRDRQRERDREQRRQPEGR